MTNIAVLIGRPTKDIELRTTPSGISVASFTLAVDRDSSKQKDEADFVPCVAWNRTAEILSQYAGKGRLICVEGRIQTRNYDNKEGQRVYVTEVVVESVKLLPSGQKAQNGSQRGSSTQQGNYAGGGYNGQQVAPQSGNNLNPEQPQSFSDPFGAGAGDAGINVSSDDLPF
ncbi:single-stranded DNA-binding protein [Lactobacillus nasalidis]|uniref:Single-stranded DNA-binding protein n=1 Tax=Lactobacillus nasalidis TaxID=2797258 RepID=A0ABQ3W592_9LACO|nr:single-stranded DNA-binding protein [Lactobacillus nasalidis]GHV97347.1 single-stranded DNA-binding protein [Lactobacillus nasalidis]GHV99943.1 single-stranded DNA-binding protein [Lactobacillus nasalidis]GHW00874.1 single-stranded DNA-binding protein [Lactobacillus nasalidis]